MKGSSNTFNLVLFLFAALLCVSVSHCSCSLHGRVKNAARMATQTSIKIIYQELETLRKNTGRYPTEEEGIPKMISHVQGFPKITPKDAWGDNFRYRLVNGKPVIDSAGGDGAFNTADDINDKSPNYQLRNGLSEMVTAFAPLAVLIAIILWIRWLIRWWRQSRSKNQR